MDEVRRAHDGPDLDPEPILGALEEHGVEFILIGGLAAASHGSIFATFDVDIVPQSGPANLERLSAALRQLGARVRAEGVEGGVPFDHDAESWAVVSVWKLITPHGMLDVSFVPSGTTGFADLARDAERRELYGVVVSIASLADVIRSKQAANRDKDRRVLPLLREILDKRLDRPDGP